MPFCNWKISDHLKWILFLLSGIMLAQPTPISSYYPSDASIAFQKAMDSPQKELILDSHFPVWNLRPMRFVNIADKTIYFEENVELRAIPGAFPNTIDALLKFVDCRNIKLLGQGNVLSMNKSEYTDGEWRHAIAIRGGKNLFFSNLILEDSGGDGIFIDRYNAANIPNTIRIDGVVSRNHKRQGISIICGKNISVTKSVFENTLGTQPGAGVDIEPDRNSDILENITFTNCVFRSNYGPGIKLALHHLTSVSRAISIGFKSCVLENNFSTQNNTAAAEIILYSNKTDPVTGLVTFDNCIVKNSQWGLIYTRKNGLGYNVLFKNCSAVNIAQNADAYPVYMEVPDYENESFLGGFKFNNFLIETKSRKPLITIRGSRSGTLKSLMNVQGTFILNKKLPSYIHYINYDEKQNSNVKLEFDLY